MFIKRKKEKMYLEAMEKVNVPKVRGEGYEVSKGKKYSFNKRKYTCIAATMIALFAVPFIVNSFNKDTNKSENSFTIIAYANDTEVKIEKDAKFELPSGYISEGSFTMQGFYINSPDLKSFKVTSSIGSVSCIMMNINQQQNFSEVMSIGDNSSMCEASNSDKQGLVVKYRSDEEISSIIKNIPQQNIENKPCDSNYIEGNSSTHFEPSSKGNIVSSQKINEQLNEIPDFSVQSECDNTVTVEQNKGSCKYYINWIPEIEFLKKLCTNSIGDYSKEKGCTLTIDVSFKDGSTMQKILTLNFDSEGKMMVECN